MDFSRAIKLYSLFLCTLGFSQYFLIRCLDPGQRDRLPHLAAWSGLTALMLTTAYQGVPVGTIKRFATGKGNADKHAVLAAVTARGFRPADDNEADAIAILLWAMETRGGVL